MVQTDLFYWYGLTAAVYIVTCWVFSVVRGVHNCGTPKERRDYIWPDRKMQVIIYLCATVLLPYVLNPRNEAAWILMKSYFPGTYYFYCGALIFCFFGTVKQWKVWKKTNVVAAIITFLAMAPLVANAWWPSDLLTEQFLQAWNIVVIAVSISMIGYASVAMWQVMKWLKIARELNYSNPDDFPTEYAHRMLLMPIILTPFLWPAYITDSPAVMAFLCIPLAIFNIVLLLNVMPVWRRAAFLTDDDEEAAAEDFEDDELAEERSNRIAAEIELFVNTEAAYLDSHLKLEQVVERCNFSRRYVSKVFTERFGGFSDYVNGLRINYFDRYKLQHPNSTDESAAEASGFTSYKSYLKAKERLLQK
jgi:AraC-like DNA-binding protein